MSRAALDRLTAQFGPAVLQATSALGNEQALVERARAKEILAFLKSDGEIAFDFLTDLTAVDYLAYPPGGREPRFEVVYQLYSTTRKHRLRVKVGVPDDSEGTQPDEPWVDSVVDLWPGANWLEREVFDLYGIRFRGHPDLRRILMYPEFVGHPLRKDYPKERRQPLARRSY
jgi:NADH-quinone oxidoreductase subunit C